MSLLPTLAPLIASSDAVKAYIGTSPIRFYPQGAAPPNVRAPYITQSVVSLTPENTLSEIPLVDGARIQLSCWGDNTGSGLASVQNLATALRDLIEPYYHVLDIRDMGRDYETQRWRIDLDVAVWAHRGAEPPGVLALSGDVGFLLLSGDAQETGNDLLELS